MPKTHDIFEIRHEQARTKVHGAYVEAIKSLGGEAAWSEDDKSVLEFIDERLRQASQFAIEDVETKWQRNGIRKA